MQCKLCNRNMKRTPIIQLIGASKLKFIGMNYFCTRQNCHHEEDTALPTSFGGIKR